MDIRLAQIAVDDSHPFAVRRAAIGASPAWRRLLRGVVEVARFTQAPVLLVGESGTGKELVGRLVHELNESAERGALAVVDCTTIVPELAGSELFGHERGAFTGAHASREGAFATAQEGTLFLDEVGDLRYDLQGKLLRALQERRLVDSERGRIADRIPIGIEITSQITAASRVSETVTGNASQISRSTETCFANDEPKWPTIL